MRIRLDHLIDSVKTQINKAGGKDQKIKIQLVLLEDVYLDQVDKEGIFIMEAYRQMSPKQRGALMAICIGTTKGMEVKNERHKVRRL